MHLAAFPKGWCGSLPQAATAIYISVYGWLCADSDKWKIVMLEDFFKTGVSAVVCLPR